MITFSNPQFWISFFYFTFCIFLAFYIPGVLVLRKISLTLFQKSVLGIIAGMVLWGWQGFLFGYLHIRWFSYIYLWFAFAIWSFLTIYKKHDRQELSSVPTISSLEWAIIIIGIFVQMLPVVFNGITTKTGLFFCCGNNSDNLFHLALTNELTKQFPPFEPGMYGVIVHNYHYWSNLVIAELIRVFGLPLIWTQFQYSGLLISLLLGLSAIVFAQLLHLGNKFSSWLLFFLYFGGDLTYALLFLLGKGFNFQISSLEDGAKFLENPPRAFSVVIFFGGLSLFLLWIKKRDFWSGLLVALLFGSLIGFKVYTGFFVLSGLLIIGLDYLFFKKVWSILPILIAFLLSVIIYLPVNTSAGGLYYTSLWRFENFISQPALGTSWMLIALEIYRQHHNIIRIIQFEFTFIFIYIVVTFGTKLLGLFETKKSLSLLPKELHLLLITGIGVSLFAGFFYEQTSGEANTFNFLVSCFIIGSIYTALACYYWSDKLRNRTKYFFIFVIVILTIPRVLVSTTDIGENLHIEPFIIPQDQLQAFQFLNTQTPQSSLLLVSNYGFNMNESSPYMSSFIHNNLYFSGSGILESHAIDTMERQKVVGIIFKSKKTVSVAEELLKANINYLILRSDENLPAQESAYFLNLIFLNNTVKILQVSQNAARGYLSAHKI